MEEAVKLIGSGPLVVLAAIGLVCVPILYADIRKRSRELVAKGEAHTGTIKAMGEACAAATKKATDDHAEALVKLARGHQEQIDRFNARIDEQTREHKKELGGMVDRVVEAMKNAAIHQQALIERTVTLTESLERRVMARDRRGG